MTEFYVYRHLQSKFHFTKKHFSKRRLKTRAGRQTCATPVSNENQKLFEKEQELANNKDQTIPKNNLEDFKLDDNWNFQNALLNVENHLNTSIQSGGQLQPLIANLMQNTGIKELESTADFPLDLLSGTFVNQEPICSDPHCNQISFYKCNVCNPSTYRDYQSW